MSLVLTRPLTDIESDLLVETYGPEPLEEIKSRTTLCDLSLSFYQAQNLVKKLQEFIQSHQAEYEADLTGYVTLGMATNACQDGDVDKIVITAKDNEPLLIQYFFCDPMEGEELLHEIGLKRPLPEPDTELYNAFIGTLVGGNHKYTENIKIHVVRTTNEEQNDNPE